MHPRLPGPAAGPVEQHPGVALQYDLDQRHGQLPLGVGDHLPVPRVVERGVGDHALGLVLAGRVRDTALTRTASLAWAGAGAGFLAMAAAPDFPLFLLAAAAIGVCTPLANVTVAAHTTATVPHRMLARVHTTQRLTVVAAGALGLPAAAALTSHLGPGTTMLTTGAVITALGAAAYARARHTRLA